MKETIRKVLKEISNQKLKKEFLDMGVEGAKKMGVSPTEYIDIVFDGDIVSYVSHFLNDLLHLDIYSSGKLYMFNGEGPFQGTVFEYKVYKPINKGVRKVVSIPKKKYDHIMKFMDKEALSDFINEYYKIDFNRIVVERETNFG